MKSSAWDEHGNCYLGPVKQSPQYANLTPKLARIKGSNQGDQGRRSRLEDEPGREKNRETDAYLQPAPEGDRQKLDAGDYCYPQEEIRA